MKNSYQKSNWKQYNQNLINRGSITFWFSKDVTKKWKAKKDKKHFGRPFTYSDLVISTAHTIRFVYHLPLRAVQGFIGSFLSIFKLSLKTPCYTQICRRAKRLDLPMLKSNKRITDVVIDASGLKVYGEGEWKVRTHGYSKRRKWMKIHIGVDPESQQIILSELTDNHGKDIDVAIDFIKKAFSLLTKLMAIVSMMQNASIKSCGKRMQFLSFPLGKIRVIGSLINLGLNIVINRSLKLMV